MQVDARGRRATLRRSLGLLAVVLTASCGSASATDGHALESPDGGSVEPTHGSADGAVPSSTEAGTIDPPGTSVDSGLPTRGASSDAASGAPDVAIVEDTSTPPDTSASDTAPPQPTATTQFAPYFYTWGWGSGSYGFSSLVEMQSKGGPSAVTIAFVLSDSGNCKATSDVQDNLDDVKAYIAAGGHVKASFGGADGQYVENACGSATDLASAISTFVDQTGITDLDFDIEQGTSTSNSAINAMRATALKIVQASKGISVAFTLPVNTDGLDDLGKAVVQSAVDAGVTISFVNVMTMDYGDDEASSDLGAIAVGSADATAKQLVTMISGLTLDAAYRRVGATAMIGDNDDSEVFTLDNAKTLVTWAKAKNLGLVSFWAIQRDEKCSSGVDLDVCNGVSTGAFQFSSVFSSVAP